MPRQNRPLDKIDTAILEILQNDCRTQLKKIAGRLGVAKSTVQYRIKRLQLEGIIEGYYAKVNATKIGKAYVTITLVRAKYAPGYPERVGRKIAQIPGVSAVYFVFGETDFFVLTKSKNREDFMEKLEKIISMPEIERSNTAIVAKTIKEDPRLELESSMR